MGAGGGGHPGEQARGVRWLLWRAAFKLTAFKLHLTAFKLHLNIHLRDGKNRGAGERGKGMREYSRQIKARSDNSKLGDETFNKKRHEVDSYAPGFREP